MPCDLAFPCATQNEINAEEAKALIDNGVLGVAEGGNMSTELDGVHAFMNAKIIYEPSKASNAGGVAVSGLERSQNSLRIFWSQDEVDGCLKDIMKSIHKKCVVYFDAAGGYINYVKDANITGFVKVAGAMVA
jgi:glutamate dehydrogenase (NADP+)